MFSLSAIVLPFSAGEGEGVVEQWVKLPLGTPAISKARLVHGQATLLPIVLPANVLRKATDDGLSIRVFIINLKQLCGIASS